MELIELLSELKTLQLFIILFSGLFIGSLLNVFNYRIPHILMYENAIMVKSNAIEVTDETKEILDKYKNFNMFFPASGCPNCNHEIKWYENIPVVSYLFLKGKCSNCKQHISIEYPFIELLTCISWVCMYFFYGWCYELPFALLMISIIISESVIDFKYKVLPDTGLFILFIIPLYLSLTGDFRISTQESIVSSISSYLIILTFVSSWEKIRNMKENMLGRGDIKYFAAIAAWVGLIGLLEVILFSVLFGLLIFIFYSLINKEKLISKTIAFAPSISLSFIFCYFYQPNLINYLIN